MCNLTFPPCFGSALVLCWCTLYSASYKPLISSMACSALGIYPCRQILLTASLCSSSHPKEPGRAALLSACLHKGAGKALYPLMEKWEIHPLYCKESDSQHYKYIVYKTHFKIYAFFMKYFFQADKQGYFSMPVLSLAWLKVLNSLPIMGITGPVVLILVWVNSPWKTQHLKNARGQLRKQTHSAGSQPGIGFSSHWLLLYLDTSNNSMCTLVHASVVKLMIKSGAAENKNPQKKFSEKHANWFRLIVATMMTVICSLFWLYTVRDSLRISKSENSSIQLLSIWHFTLSN